MPHDLRPAVAEHNSLRAQLLQSFPELDDDMVALQDTLEGLSSLPEQIAAVLRSAVEREAMAEGLAALMKERASRKSRLEAGAEKLRDLAKQAMQEAGLSRVTAPDLTASLSAGKPKVLVTHLDDLPDDYVQIERKPLKRLIAMDLEGGKEIPGAVLGNAEPRLTVRKG